MIPSLSASSDSNSRIRFCCDSTTVELLERELLNLFLADMAATIYSSDPTNYKLWSARSSAVLKPPEGRVPMNTINFEVAGCSI